MRGRRRRSWREDGEKGGGETRGETVTRMVVVFPGWMRDGPKVLSKKGRWKGRRGEKTMRKRKRERTVEEGGGSKY